MKGAPSPRAVARSSSPARSQRQSFRSVTAPIGVVSDAFPLLGQVDGVIAVTRMGRSTRDSAERLREQLARLDAPVLGIVANGIKLRRGGRYGYGYYGGYYGRAAESAEAAEPAEPAEAAADAGAQ